MQKKNTELLSIDGYIKSNAEEREEYLQNRLELRENKLIGTVKVIEGDTFIIEDLFNPFTGVPLEHTLLKFADITNRVIGKISKSKLKPREIDINQLVLLNFELSELDREALGRGDILTTRSELVNSIRDLEDLLNQLNISMPHPLDYNKNRNFYANYFAEELKEKQAELKEDRKEIELKKAEITKLNKKVDIERREMEELRKQLINLGFNFEKEQSEDDQDGTINTLVQPADENELLYLIQQQLLKRGLHYNLKTLRQYYSVLKTNQLVILSGPSGTGKTSLVKAFAEVTGGVAKIIPVQPSWTDKQDLLGFYNPLQKQYVSTNFLDAMIEARQEENKDKLYYICLDELNLAEVEYYLADILSTREIDSEPLQLYSQFVYEQNKEEVNWFVQKLFNDSEQENLDRWIKNSLGVNTKEQYKYIQMHKNMTRYPWAFDIPDNVRIIGTMNIDGTVRPVAPKVIDRSFVIHLDIQNTVRQEIDEKGQIKLKAEDMVIAELTEALDQVNDSINDSIGEDLMELNAAYNNRVANHIFGYMQAASSFNIDDINEKELLDDALMMKVLPRINFLINNVDTNAHNRFPKNLGELVGKQSESYKKAQDMLLQAQKTNIYTYWS